MSYDNSDLYRAFPSSVRTEVNAAVSVLPITEYNEPSAFSVFVAGEFVRIPYRINHDVELIDSSGLTGLQKKLLDCILSRHGDGFIREKHLRNVIASRYEWVPPFVIQLLGEYVVEILCAIRDVLPELDESLYRTFLLANPVFFDRTKQRVRSYWYCYYTNVKREDYAGFEIIRFLEGLGRR
jgi:hypothetical protein